VALPVAIRAYEPEPDGPFVYKSWIESYRNSKRAGVVPGHVFYALHKIAINQLLSRGMHIAMAVNPDDRDQVLGFIAWESPGPILHYCFTKSIFRRQGVASLLTAYANFAPEGPIFCTHWTPMTKHLGEVVVHCPEFARRKDPYDPAVDGPLHA
jgi:hypothetical protein